MKATNKHRAILREAVAAIEATIPGGLAAARQEYRDGCFSRADRVKDLARRYRWDVFRAADCSTGYVLSQTLYADGLNDTHIDTMLRADILPVDHETRNGEIE